MPDLEHIRLEEAFVPTEYAQILPGSDLLEFSTSPASVVSRICKSRIRLARVVDDSIPMRAFGNSCLAVAPLSLMKLHARTEGLRIRLPFRQECGSHRCSR